MTSHFKAGMCFIIKLQRNSGVTLSYPCITLFRVFTIALALGRLNSGNFFIILLIASPMISTFRSTPRTRNLSLRNSSNTLGRSKKKLSTSSIALSTSTRCFSTYSSINKEFCAVDVIAQNGITNSFVFQQINFPAKYAAQRIFKVEIIVGIISQFHSFKIYN